MPGRVKDLIGMFGVVGVALLQVSLYAQKKKLPTPQIIGIPVPLSFSFSLDRD